MATAKRNDPYRSFRFKVKIDSISIAAFSEATVPDIKVANVEYRNGNEPTFMRQLSGLTAFGTLTLKNGITDSLELYKWFQKITAKGALDNRKSITITLIDEQGNDKVNWNIREAWPIRYEDSALNSSANEVQIETLEIVHEGIERTR